MRTRSLPTRANGRRGITLRSRGQQHNSDRTEGTLGRTWHVHSWAAPNERGIAGADFPLFDITNVSFAVGREGRKVRDQHKRNNIKKPQLSSIVAISLSIRSFPFTMQGFRACTVTDMLKRWWARRSRCRSPGLERYNANLSRAKLVSTR